MTVHWCSPVATLIVAVFLIIGVAFVASGHDLSGVVYLGLALAYIPIRLARGYLAAAAQSRRGH